MRFVDLFAGLGGFHLALERDYDCVFASEIDLELNELYQKNFPHMAGRVYGDIRSNKHKVPPHDILCAGFPCQPFSKSGQQLGIKDKTRGTLFNEICEIIDLRKPKYILLENVGNFERHDRGRTWQVVEESLTVRGYDVRGTEHLTSGGPGLISPHHLGFPHTRERFFIVASRLGLPKNPFPHLRRDTRTNLADVVQCRRELSRADVSETALTNQQLACIEHWNVFIQALPLHIEPPSFPIWGDEFRATYPFELTTPYIAPLHKLRGHIPPNGYDRTDRAQLLSRLPSYARTACDRFPDWKVRFISQNRTWLRSIRGELPRSWVTELMRFPPSLRKFEWNCKGEIRDLWRHVLQFRPSGLRVKRYTSSPALVAMTTTQIPVLGPERRFLTRREGLLLQGFPVSHRLPISRAKAFSALGNAVHVGVVRAIARRVLP